jgi:SpoVK/Ycf46/Vps4 family AAA+-type ATPase
LRAALAVIEAIGRCVLLFDEVEKSLAGATSGAADGGVASDALGTLLTWMQERKGAAFIIATSNDVTKLPPELLRKGRFDEMFFVDLPTRIEREEIIRVTMQQYGRGDVSIDVSKVARACVDFTGSEIAALLPEALFAAFADSERQVTTEDLLTAAANIVPLAKTAADKITTLREWAKTRARRASLPEVEEVTGNERNLDL